MSDILLFGQTLLEWSWEFFTKTYIPGTEITVAQLSIGLLLITIGFDWLSGALGMQFGGSGEDYGSRGSRKAKISQERRGDDR